MAALMGQASGEHVGWEGYDRIPPVFKKLHPNLTPANYALLKKDPLFLYSRMAVCDQCFLLLTADHAPRLPIVERMPSSLLMERNHGAITNSIGASMGVPVNENHSLLRQSSVSPVGGMNGRESALSGKETRLGFYNEAAGAEQTRHEKGGNRSHISLGGSTAVTNRRQMHGDRSHSSLSMGAGGGMGHSHSQQASQRGGQGSIDNSMMSGEGDQQFTKKPTKPRLVPPLDTGNPVKLAGYTYAGNNTLSRAPRRSTRVAENFVSSVATSQFTKKVEERVQPLQMTPAPQALDFVANNALPAARSLLQEHQGLKGFPDTSLALSVLEGEEAFLRTLHPGMGDPVKQQGPFSEEERRLARAAATGAKKKLDSKKRPAGAGKALSPEKSAEDEGGGSAHMSVVAENSSASFLSAQQGAIRKGRAKSWLHDSPLLPGGGFIRDSRKPPGASAHIDVCVCVCMCVCVCECDDVSGCLGVVKDVIRDSRQHTYTHTHIYIRTHTYIYAHTHLCRCLSAH